MAVVMPCPWQLLVTTAPVTLMCSFRLDFNKPVCDQAHRAVRETVGPQTHLARVIEVPCTYVTHSSDLMWICVIYSILNIFGSKRYGNTQISIGLEGVHTHTHRAVHTVQNDKDKPSIL